MAADALLLFQVLPCPGISLHVRPDREGVDKKKCALEVVAYIGRRCLPVFGAGLNKGRPGGQQGYSVPRTDGWVSGRSSCTSCECKEGYASEAAQCQQKS